MRLPENERKVLTMAEYIEREALINSFRSCGASKDLIDSIVYRINLQEAADVAPVRHGQWGVDGVYVVCSVCNRITLSPIVKRLPTFKYCPNCGAKMDKETKK